MCGKIAVDDAELCCTPGEGLLVFQRFLVVVDVVCRVTEDADGGPRLCDGFVADV